MVRVTKFLIGGIALLSLTGTMVCLERVSYAAGQEKAQAAKNIPPQNDEKAAAQRDLTKAKVALAEYDKKISESPEIVEMKKSLADLEAALKAKQKELSGITAQKIDKDPAYIKLVDKKKEFDKINSDLAAKRKDAGNDPKVAALRKEVADLKATFDAKTKEADALVETKLNSDQTVKDLTQEKKALESAPKDVSDFRTKVMADPAVKALNDQIQEMTQMLREKRAEMNTAIAEKSQSDAQHMELADKVDALNAQAGGKKMPLQERAPGNAAAPTAGPISMDQVAEKKLAAELANLLSAYQKNKVELEESVEKIKDILKQLPPQSPLYKNTTDAILKINASKGKR